MLLDMVEVFDIGRATMGGRYFVTCQLSWEMQVHLYRVSRRPRLVQEIIAVVQEVFESEVFEVYDCGLIFADNGIRLQNNYHNGASVARNPNIGRDEYQSGNIDSWEMAYFFYICLQRVLNLIKADILKYAEDKELAEKPCESVVSFRRELPKKRKGRS